VSADGQVMRLRDGDVSWRTVGDEVIVLDGRSWAYLSVNGSGELLWSLLARGATEAQLGDALVRDYEVDDARARADVRAFLDALREHDLIAAAGP
jgi:hypothetical protein